MSLRVSVVIPTYRRPDLLDRCLAALLEQTLSPREFEIIVADDAASSETRAQVESWSRGSAVELIYVAVQGNHGPAAARNAGWMEARAPLVAFTDDDTLPDLKWLEAGLEGMADPKLIAASGRVVMPLPEVPTDYERDAAGLVSAEFVTANCFARKSALEAIGGFDERFTAAWREDSDLHFNLLKLAERQGRGERVGSLDRAVIVHPIRPGRWGISLLQQRKSIFNALLYKKHPELYRKRIQKRPPLRYYGILLCLLAAVAGTLTGARALTALSLALWIALTLSFCAKRLARSSWSPEHVLEMLVTSMLIPPVAVYWRIRGALRYGVLFL